VTEQLDKIWAKHAGNPTPYGLCDSAIDEKRVPFVCDVDRITTFGKPRALAGSTHIFRTAHILRAHDHERARCARSK